MHNLLKLPCFDLHYINIYISDRMKSVVWSKIDKRLKIIQYEVVNFICHINFDKVRMAYKTPTVLREGRMWDVW